MASSQADQETSEELTIECSYCSGAPQPPATIRAMAAARCVLCSTCRQIMKSNGAKQQ